MKIKFLLILFLSTCLTACLEAESDSLITFKQTLNNHEHLGAARFLLDDFGGLNGDTLKSNALPWKLITTALIYREHRLSKIELSQNSISIIYKKFGFLTNPKILNWPYTEQPKSTGSPIGISKGIGRINGPLKYAVEISNINCSACHAGTSYDQNGVPTLQIHLGTPNTSLDINAMVNTIVDSIYEEMMDEKLGLKKIKTIYPEISEVELKTLKRMYDKLQKRIKELKNEINANSLISNGSPGTTNGIGSLKMQIGLLSEKSFNKDEVGYTSIPEISSRYLRSSLLYDGAYTSPELTRFKEVSASSSNQTDFVKLLPSIAFFRVPIMGIPLKDSTKNLGNLQDAVEFISNLESIKFPGSVDFAQAARGEQVFKNTCSQCHGEYQGPLNNLKLTHFPNKLITLDKIKTDPNRAKLVTADVVNKINKSNVGKYINAAQTNGYVAPILNGLWATAPYLHNGSVPTLWHMMNPEERPTKFLVGGHKLDFNKVGIELVNSNANSNSDSNNDTLIYPQNYQPWSTPQIYDTTNPGRSNKGHERQFSELTKDQKSDLIEFLKLI